MSKSFRAAMVLVLLVLGVLMSMPVRAEETATAPILLPSTPAPVTPLQPGAETPTFMVTRACCLDEWQPGNCPAGTRVFAYCTGACDVCGSFTCVSNTTSCLK